MAIPRVDFRPQEFVDLINQKGLRLKWEKAIPCPCVDPKTKQFVSNCSLCSGNGRYYVDSKEIKGLILRQQKDPAAEHALGTLNLGEAYLTVEHDNFMALWDRVTNLDSLTVFNDIIQHDPVEGDYLTYTPAAPVQFAVTSVGRDAGAINLIQGTDYTIDNGGKITWLTDKVKDEGQSISFRYMHRPTWIVVQTPNYVRDTFVKQGQPVETYNRMPVRFVIRLEYLNISAGNAAGAQ